MDLTCVNLVCYLRIIAFRVILYMYVCVLDNNFFFQLLYKGVIFARVKFSLILHIT